MSEPKIDISEIKAQIKSISHSEKRDLFNWTLDYLLVFKDLVITKEYKKIPELGELNFNSDELASSSFKEVISYVFSYKSEVIFIFRFGSIYGWELPYYNNLMKTFKGITKVLNDRVLSKYSSEYTMCNYTNLYWYLKDLIKVSLLNLDYPGIKA